MFAAPVVRPKTSNPAIKPHLNIKRRPTRIADNTHTQYVSTSTPTSNSIHSSLSTVHWTPSSSITAASPLQLPHITQQQEQETITAQTLSTTHTSDAEVDTIAAAGVQSVFSSSLQAAAPRRTLAAIIADNKSGFESKLLQERVKLEIERRNKQRQRRRVKRDGKQLSDDETQTSRGESLLDSSVNGDSAASQSVGPRVRIDANGEVVVDEESLVVQSESIDRSNTDYAVVDEQHGFLNSMSSSFKEQALTRQWSNEETIRFYKCLAQVGTDFTLISQYFQRRSRKQCKLKYKREERRNPSLIAAVLRKRLPISIPEYERQRRRREREENGHAADDEEEETESQSKQRQTRSQSKVSQSISVNSLAPNVDTRPHKRRKKSQSESESEAEFDQESEISDYEANSSPTTPESSPSESSADEAVESIETALEQAS